MTKFEQIESIITSFETALNNANMQNKFGKANNKPYYFRGEIPQTRVNDLLLLRYNVTDSIPLQADNLWHTLAVYINASLFINSADGFSNTKYQNLLKKIEEEVIKLGFSIKYGMEMERDLLGDATTITYQKELEFTIRR